MKYPEKITTLLFALMLLPFTIAAGPNGLVDGDGEEQEVRTVAIKGTDQLKFDITEIQAVPGETIRIEFTTVSRMPKIAMAHNVVILKKGTDIGAFVNASAMARDNGYVAPEFEDQIIAATPLAGGGETVEVTFTVPEEAGEYTFVCSFPGHYLGGMKGVLAVGDNLAL